MFILFLTFSNLIDMLNLNKLAKANAFVHFDRFNLSVIALFDDIYFSDGSVEILASMGPTMRLNV